MATAKHNLTKTSERKPNNGAHLVGLPFLFYTEKNPLTRNNMNIKLIVCIIAILAVAAIMIYNRQKSLPLAQP